MKYKRDFFVCFRRSRKDHWWQIFTGKKRSHIFLITPCEKNSCVMIDPSEGGLGIYAYPHSAIDVAKNSIGNGCEVVQYRVEEEDMTGAYPKLFRTCVTIAKDLLGIRKWWIVTPGQLFNELRRR